MLRSCRSPRTAAIWRRSTSLVPKCPSSATRSANASCSAAPSAESVSNSIRIPSSSACVTLCAITSCDRQVKTDVAPGCSSPVSWV
jgi:hypothetical protein